ncbi:MAG: hypothetical protein HQK66_09305 [Desulfamplus sp.]|nr:hypothetical protein [Desulfamplus sp.]
MKSYSDNLSLQDGVWQTVRIPLDGRFFDWRYPQGQNGALAVMDMSAIGQIEFVPWEGDDHKKGLIYLDNLRLTGPGSQGNRLPRARVESRNMFVMPEEPCTLNGEMSHDPDGEVSSWQWIPGNSKIPLSHGTWMDGDGHLSDSFSSAPVFKSSWEGVYLYDLVVTDNMGAKSRNIAQVKITVSSNPPDAGGSVISQGGGVSGGGCFCSVIMTDIYPQAKEGIKSMVSLFIVAVSALLAWHSFTRGRIQILKRN